MKTNRLRAPTLNLNKLHLQCAKLYLPGLRHVLDVSVPPTLNLIITRLWFAFEAHKPHEFFENNALPTI